LVPNKPHEYFVRGFQCRVFCLPATPLKMSSLFSVSFFCQILGQVAYSVIFSSHLFITCLIFIPLADTKLKIVLYGCETWLLTLK
jgi:hypothetical protein